MIILIDTCILYSDRFLRGKVYKILRSANLTLGARIMVPGIVLEELLRQYEDALDQATRALLREKGVLEGLGINIELDSNNIQTRARQLTNDFKNTLTEKLATIGGSVLEYPDVPHSKIAIRAIRRIRPFADSGKGYQDTLIWLSALKILTEHPTETLILLTGNTKDFCEKEKVRLHEELIADLKQHRIQPTRISLVKSETELYQNYIEPAEDRLRAARERFNEDESWIRYVTGIIEETLQNEGDRIISRNVSHRDVESVVALDSVQVHSLKATDAWSEGTDIILAGDADITGQATLRIGRISNSDDYWDAEDVECSMNISFLATVDIDAGSVLDAKVVGCGPVDVDLWE